jgi:hypothetical protein
VNKKNEEKNRKLIEMDQKEQKDREQKTIYSVLNSPKVFEIVAECLTLKEYVQLGALNKRFHKDLRDTAGARACLNFIRVKYIVK